MIDHLPLTHKACRDWDRWIEDNPADSGVVRGARPITDEDRVKLREQHITRLGLRPVEKSTS